MTGPARERLPGVPRLCHHCWHPIRWGEVTWRLIACVPEPQWGCWHPGCVPADRETRAA